MSVLTQPHFYDETKAYEFIEGHLWADGRVCPFCGTVGNSTKLQGKSTRIGLYKCKDCRKPFTVKIGTIFESSHVPLHLWLQAIALMSSSKKGISANQLHRTLGITLKSAWFLAHRIREAMRVRNPGPLGGEGKFVEADETYLGQVEGVKKPKGGWKHKMKVMTLVERDGRAHSVRMESVTSTAVHDHLRRYVDPATHLMSDQANFYKKAPFAKKSRVQHNRGEYVRGEAHTNTVEGFFSIFKRGMKGIYQHCGEQHLNRYLAEFDFRYNNRVALGVNDEGRAINALKGAKGKRLTYRTTDRQIGVVH